MKNQIKKIAAAALLIASYTYAAAQVPPPVNVPPPPLAGAAGLVNPPAPGNISRPPFGAQPILPQPLESLTTISGKVSGYVTNDRYAYDGLTLQGSNGTINVKFPEHLGKQLMNVAKKGKNITIKGFNLTGPDGVTTFQMVTAVVGNIQIQDIPPAPPLQPFAPEPKTYSGSITNFRYDPQGIINGINLNNKVVIDLPPPATSQLQSLLKAGDQVEVSGFKETPPAGVMLANNAPFIIHPQTITLKGQTYLLR